MRRKNEMFVRVTARAESEEAAEALCRPVVEEICRRYGDVVYGVDVDNLESVVVRLLSEKGLHLATAESCTGGLVAKLITDVSGASEVFGMGLVTYANEAKMKLLGVPAAMLEEHGGRKRTCGPGYGRRRTRSIGQRARHRHHRGCRADRGDAGKARGAHLYCAQ